MENKAQFNEHLMDIQLAELRGEIATFMENIRGDIKALRQELIGEDRSLKQHLDFMIPTLKDTTVEVANLAATINGLQSALNRERSKNEALTQRVEKMESWLVWGLRLLVGTPIMVAFGVLLSKGN